MVMFAEPPSVVGIAGGQMAEGAPGAAAVVLADCVEVSSPSPGNSRGTCELREKGALIPLLPAAEPEGVADPPLVGADVPVENEDIEDEDIEDSVDVGTPSGSVPVFVVI